MADQRCSPSRTCPIRRPVHRDVVVAVGLTALNRLDVVQRNGWYTMPGFTLPHIAGMDVAGTVALIGDEVDGVAPGDRVVVDPSLAGVPEGSKLAGRGDLYGELGVIGATTDGGYAELCLAPATHVYQVPEHMSLEDAATFPTCHLTASHGLFDVGRLVAGETVLVHAAGSGVSIAAIQLAARAGATVLATAGTPAKLERAAGLGAAHVLNNRTGNVLEWAREVTDGRGVDMVFDHVGTALFESSLFALATHGRLVTCGNTSGDVATIPVTRVRVPSRHHDPRQRALRAARVRTRVGALLHGPLRRRRRQHRAARGGRGTRRSGCSTTRSSARSWFGHDVVRS